LAINVQPFAGIDNHSGWLDRLSEMPADLVLSEPAPFAAPVTNRYDSALLQEMVGLLRQRMAGSTGIAPAVEQAIWGRGRAREAVAAEANTAEIMRTSEARGFAFPDGALHAALREAQRVSLAKSAELSRDIAIKQAELEQANARHAIEQGVALESQLIGYANNIEQRAFEAARFAAQNAVEIYNAIVAKYRVALDKYNTYASIYRSLIETETAKVAAYRASVEAETAKVDINKSLIEEQRLQIEVRNARIAAYRAELEGVQSLLAVDKLKIESFAERIRAYVAELEAETTRVEAYKARIGADQARTDIYRAQVEAHVAKINSASATARTRADIYDAEVRAFATRVQAYGTRVNAEAEKARTAVSIEGLKVEVAKLNTEQATSNNQLQIEQYKALITGYEAAKQVATQQAKLISDNYFTLKSILADAAKVGAQVNAQMAASAYGTIQANAEISGRDSTDTSFSYSGDTSDTRAAPVYG
jgi:chromosome segregation ATPase